MYLRKDRGLLKTKIVATIGIPRGGIFDINDNFKEEAESIIEDAENFLVRIEDAIRAILNLKVR